jgi:hypothetical protein
MKDEERKRILREARENVRLRDFPHAANVHHADPPPRVSKELRREWRRPEPEQPKPELDTNPELGRQATWDAWNAWCDQRIAAAIAAERAFMVEVVGAAIGQMLDEESEEHKRALSLEVRELKIEIAKLQCALAEQRAFSAAGDRRSVLDLPNPLTNKSVN